MEEITRYNSQIKMMELETIEVQGEEFIRFSIGSYPIIVRSGVIDIDRENEELRKVSHTPTMKSSVGIRDGKTFLVQVVSGRGVTAKELAQLMVQEGCEFASITGSAIIDEYLDLMIPTGVVIEPPNEETREQDDRLTREYIEKHREENKEEIAQTVSKITELIGEVAKEEAPRKRTRRK